METKTYLIIYVAIAFVFEAIFLYYMWGKFKKKMDSPQFQMIKGMVANINSFQALKKKIFNPFTLIFAGIPILVLISPFLFPLTIISMLKKLIFGKSKLEKQADAEQKMMQEAFGQSQDFLKNEGREMHITEIDLDFKIDLNIEEKPNDDGTSKDN